MGIQLQVSNLNNFKLNTCNWTPMPSVCQSCTVLSCCFPAVCTADWTNLWFFHTEEVLKDFPIWIYFTDTIMVIGLRVVQFRGNQARNFKSALRCMLGQFEITRLNTPWVNCTILSPIFITTNNYSTIIIVVCLLFLTARSNNLIKFVFIYSRQFQRAVSPRKHQQ